MHSGQVSIQHALNKFFQQVIWFSYNFSTIRGRIDQVNQVLELGKESRSAVRYNAIDKWSNQIQSLQLAVINKMA